MDSYTLVYKIHKGIVLVEDYIVWSHTLLQNNVSSNALNRIAALTPKHNLFEVEDYFKKALNELQRMLSLKLICLITKNTLETHIQKVDSAKIFSVNRLLLFGEYFKRVSGQFQS